MAEVQERPGRSFRTAVAVAIAIVSVFGAVAAWRASVVSILASDLNEEGLLTLVQKEQVRAQLESLVDEDLRLFAEYQEHIAASRLLRRDADRVRNPELAEDLRAQAQGELALARALIPFFRGATPDLGGEEGDVAYDRAFVLANLQEFDPTFSELRPGRLFAQARTEHTRTVNLVLVVALFVAALFFLTIAQFARPSNRGIFAVAGGATAAVALTLFVLIGALA
jgi:hypothetical protein